MELVKQVVAYLKLKYGKVNTGSVIGKLLYLKPELKSKVRELIPEINKAIQEVEKLDKEKLEKLTSEVKPLFEKKEESKGDITLPNAEEGKVVTRFAPNPSGFLHIGHARAIVLNHYLARKYKGRFILRIEDTDPDVKKPMLEAYEQIPRDVEWLTQDKPDQIVIQSDRLDLYYKLIEQLIREGKAYVCLCKPEEFRKYRDAKKPCPHRDQPVERNLELWEKMLSGEFKKGEAVVRLKTDLNHKDPGVRDFPIARIVENPHPRVGYKPVFPLYNFSVVVDDHLLGITHVIRMKEHTNNAVKQSFIYKAFGWKEPIYIEYGALLTDMPTHKSEIRKLIEEGKITGWDDPRIPTLMALRRRGILPEAIYEYILKDVGLNKADIKVDWNKIYYYHKLRVDKKTPRYFMIRKPIRVVIENYDDLVSLVKKVQDGLEENPYIRERFSLKDGKVYVRVPKHPEAELGIREIPLEEVLLIDERDAKILNEKGYLRLFDLFNIKFKGEFEVKYGYEELEKKEKALAVEIDSFEVEMALQNKWKIVQWLPESYSEKAKLLELDGYKEALVEKNIKEDYVHFLREGYYKKEPEQWIFSVK